MESPTPSPTQQFCHDAAGRLNRLRHQLDQRVLSQFVYEVDGRGNRTRVLELLPKPSNTTATYDKDTFSYPKGTWSNNGDFKQTSAIGAVAEVSFNGREAVLTYGVGPHHGRFDLTINDTLYRTLDAYANAAGERSLNIQLTDDGANHMATMIVSGMCDLHPSLYKYAWETKLCIASYCNVVWSFALSCPIIIQDHELNKDKGHQMIVVNNRIPVNPEYAEAFEDRFKQRAQLVDGMDGFISFQILRPTKDGDPYVVMTFWESQAHFEAWTNSEEFKQGHAQSSTLPREAFLGHPAIEVYEVIQSTSKIASE